MTRTFATKKNVLNHSYTRQSDQFYFFSIIFILILLFISNGRGDFRFSDNPSLPIYFDYWCYQDEDQQNLMTLFYIQVDPSAMRVVNSESGSILSYELGLYIYNKLGELIKKQHLNDTLTIDHDDIGNPIKSRLFRLPFHLNPGKYRVMISLKDENGQKASLLEKYIEIKNRHSVLVSDLLLAVPFQLKKFSQKEKSSPCVMPFPAGVYGLNQPKLLAYFERYSKQNIHDNQFDFEIFYLSPTGKRVSINKIEKRFLNKKNIMLATLDTKNLSPGKYKLFLKIYINKSKLYVERQKTFYVLQDPIDLTFKSYRQALKEISLIASKEEFAHFKQLPKSEHQKALIKFWDKLDPTPQTIRNEAKNEFYRRLKFVKNKNWCTDRAKKWLTDRGRVFMVYGHPNKIYRKGNKYQHFSQEIWQYSKDSIQFVFQDNDGIGEFQLVKPYSLLY